MAKLFASKIVMDSAIDCVQLRGLWLYARIWYRKTYERCKNHRNL